MTGRIRSRRAWGPLGRRLLALAVAGTVALALILAVLFGLNRGSRATLTLASESFAVEQSMAADMGSAVTRQLAAVAMYTIRRDEEVRRRFEASGRQVQTRIRQYLFRDLTVDERVQLEDVKEHHHRLEVAAARVFELLAQGGEAEAEGPSAALMDEALGLQEALERFLTMREAQLGELRDRQARTLSGITTAGGVAAAILLLGTIFAGRFLHRRLAAPLGELTEAAERLGAGDLDVRVHVGADDEIGALSRSFNSMAEGLAAAKRDLEHQNEALHGAMERLTAAQAELIQTEKLSAMGRMTAGLAHELNNPLASIMGYGEMLLERMEAGDPPPAGEVRDEYLTPIVQEARRSRELVKNLVRFSRPSDSALEPVSVREAVEVVVGVRRHAFQKRGLGIRVVDLPVQPVMAESQRLQQVVLNIVSNAMDALDEAGGGELRIGGHVEGDRVVLAFEDDGPGFSHPAQVFEPFFTTKPPGEGTGLGLALVHRFMEEFGGGVSARNAPSGGARVELTFRAAPAEAEVAEPPRAGGGPVDVPRPEPPRPPPAAPGGGASGHPPRILVVEDEAPLRVLQERLLRRIDAEVLVADAAAEARHLLEGEAVDLVISDIRMPGESGLDLFHWMEEHHPDLARTLVFVTGDIGDDEAAEMAEREPRRFIHKPFEIEEYLDRVGRALGGGRDGA